MKKISIGGISAGVLPAFLLDTEAKIVEGPSPDWKKFGQPNSGNGSGGSIFGLPRFDRASFLARFPFGHITLEDKNFPLKAEIKGWSPFIPNRC